METQLAKKKPAVHRLTGPRVRRARPIAVETPLQSYLGAINETALLSAKEERELAYRIEEGDVEARDHMARANLRLVVNLARGYLGRGLSLQDLIAEGNLGLLRAVEAFDPTMNTRFSTYASYWIRQSMKRAVLNSAKTIRIPAYMVDLLVKWHRAAAALNEEKGRTPTPEEIAQKMRLSKKKLKIIQQVLRLYNAVPELKDEEDGWPMSELFADERAKGPDVETVEADDVSQVMRLLESMDPREATVLRLRFGLADGSPKTLMEIGECLDLTRERVRQIEVEALAKLREKMGAED